MRDESGSGGRRKGCAARLVAAVLALLSLPLAACGGSSDGSAISPPPRKFLFATRGLSDAEGQFAAVTSDPAVLAKLESELALPDAQRALHVSGRIAEGNLGQNLSWSWHFVPGAWDLVEMSVEICDGRPADVEKDLAHWVNDIGVFCPWNSYVLREL